MPKQAIKLYRLRPIEQAQRGKTKVMWARLLIMAKMSNEK